MRPNIAFIAADSLQEALNLVTFVVKCFKCMGFLPVFLTEDNFHLNGCHLLAQAAVINE